jgi:hypothetical protein
VIRSALGVVLVARTLLSAGIYDSLNSCPLIAYQISRLEPALRERITFGCYAGGHMMYEDRAARVSLRRDLARFSSLVSDRRDVNGDTTQSPRAIRRATLEYHLTTLFPPQAEPIYARLR